MDSFRQSSKDVANSFGVEFLDQSTDMPSSIRQGRALQSLQTDRLGQDSLMTGSGPAGSRGQTLRTNSMLR